MPFVDAQHWPVIFICVAMVAAGIIDWAIYKVPNWLTMPVIVSGWLLGLLHNFHTGIVTGDGVGGIGAALAGTFLGMALLLPFYLIEGMGAGDVKMLMGFGSWMGAYYGLDDFHCLYIIALSFCLGGIVGGIIGIGMILARGDFAKNKENARGILMDLATGSLTTIQKRSRERKPRWQRLPYGVPLCIGFVGYLWIMHPEIHVPSHGSEGAQTPWLEPQRHPDASSVAAVMKVNIEPMPEAPHVDRGRLR